MPKLSMKRSAGAASPAPKRRKLASKAGEAKYGSLWNSAEVTKGWNARGADHWKKQPASLQGTTGDGVSRADIAFSRKALGDLVTSLRKYGSKRCKAGRKLLNKVSGDCPEQYFGKTLELGAGIGRVSQGVLRHYCRAVHLVEFMKHYVDKAKKTLPRSGCKFTFQCSSAQKCRIPVNHYNLIWCQGLLMYLTDTDSVDLLKRASKGLAKSGGVLVVKENIIKALSADSKYFDGGVDKQWQPGSSKGPMNIVRTRKHFEHLFKRAGLRISGSRRQVSDVGDLEDDYFWVLEPSK